jgi:VanZ family protein
MAVLYAGSDEFHQSFTSGRHPSVMDVGIDTLGAITGALFFRWLTEKPKLRRYFSR